jgi:hypothetical protein
MRAADGDLPRSAAGTVQLGADAGDLDGSGK